MKRIVAILLAVGMTVALCSCGKTPVSYEATYTNMGSPVAKTGATGTVSCCAWDIELLDNRLWVGSGDYDKNMGPVHMWYYDFELGEWAKEDKLQDEQVGRLHLIGDKLYAPGYDPRDSWELGNYYTYSADDRKWQVNRVLPGGVHNFDLIEFKGKWFAGLGVVGKDSPIAMSEDGGATWTGVPLYKDGVQLETKTGSYIRVYDFFCLKNSLYAYFYFQAADGKLYRDVYRYDGDKFVYHSDLIKRLASKRATFNHIDQKTEFKGRSYIANGYLYKTEDLIEAEQIELGENVRVNDIRKIGKYLYILCNEQGEDANGEEEFRVSVRRSKNGDTFDELFYFTFPVRALSFTYDDGTFYFGTGYGKNAEYYYFDNGSVLSVEYP